MMKFPDTQKLNSPKIMTAFLAGLILFGFLFCSFSYGINLDQRSEQKILFSNIKSYLKIFGQENGSLYSELELQGILCIEDNIDRYNGMAVFYPAFPVYFINKTSPYIGMLVWQSYIFLIYSLGLVSLFSLLSSLFSNIKTAYLGTLLYFLTPRMFAEGHYNNKDMVLLSLLFCAMLCARMMWEKLSLKWIIGFSVAGAFVTNMKIIGLFIWGGMGLFILLSLIINKRMNLKVFGKAAVSLAVFVLVYMCITPASRFGLFSFWLFLTDSAKNFWWNDYVLFKGALFNKEITGIPADYLPTMILITVPVGILILFVIGLIGNVFDLIRHPSKIVSETGFCLACFVLCFIPLVYAIYNKTPVYNGWRHFYFTYAGFTLMSSCGIDLISRLFAKKKITEFVLWGYAAVLFIGILINHPYEYSFYNVFAGKDIETVYELDYWDMSFKQAYEFLLNESDGETFTVATISNPGKWGLENQYFSVRGKVRNRILFSDNWKDADYLIINPTYAYMYSNSEYEYIKTEFELIKEIDSYGNTICEIYKR